MMTAHYCMYLLSSMANASTRNQTVPSPAPTSTSTPPPKPDQGSKDSVFITLDDALPTSTGADSIDNIPPLTPIGAAPWPHPTRWPTILCCPALSTFCNNSRNNINNNNAFNFDIKLCKDKNNYTRNNNKYNKNNSQEKKKTTDNNPNHNSTATPPAEPLERAPPPAEPLERASHSLLPPPTTQAASTGPLLSEDLAGHHHADLNPDKLLHKYDDNDEAPLLACPDDCPPEFTGPHTKYNNNHIHNSSNKTNNNPKHNDHRNHNIRTHIIANAAVDNPVVPQAALNSDKLMHKNPAPQNLVKASQPATAEGAPGASECWHSMKPDPSARKPAPTMWSASGITISDDELVALMTNPPVESPLYYLLDEAAEEKWNLKHTQVRVVRLLATSGTKALMPILWAPPAEA